MFSSSRPKVYLEIDESKLFIGRLKKKKNKFFCDVFDEWPLTAFEVKDGVIYKPTVLYLLIKSFLSDNKLSGSKAVVCCPYLSKWKGIDKRMPFFQISLYVAKSGLKIFALIGESILSEIGSGDDKKLMFDIDELKKKFDFFCHFRLKSEKNVANWVLGSSISFIILLALVSSIHLVTYKRGQLSELSELSKLSQATEVSVDYTDSEDKTIYLGDNLDYNAEKIDSSVIERKKLFGLFGAMSGIIPKKTWIDSFGFDKNRDFIDHKYSLNKKGAVSIKGYSSDYSEVVDFYKKIGALSITDKCSIKYSKKGGVLKFRIIAQLS